MIVYFSLYLNKLKDIIISGFLMKSKSIWNWILLGVVIYLALVVALAVSESRIAGASIKNFGDSVWFSIVTLATVGYGDKFPVSTTGKFIGAAFVLSSLGLLSTIISKTSSIINEKMEKKKMGYFGTDFSDHIVIIGYDKFARSIIRILCEEEKKVVLVSDNRDEIGKLYESFSKKFFFAVFADYNDSAQIQKAALDKANTVFVNLKSDTDKLITILNLKKLHPNLKYMVTLEDQNLKDTFESAGVTYIISKEEISSKLIASYIFEPFAAKYTLDIMEGAKSDDDYDVQQYVVTGENEYVGKNYGFLFNDVKQRTNALPIGIYKRSVNDILKLPDDSLKIEQGDYILIITNKSSKDAMEELFGVKQGM